MFATNVSISSLSLQEAFTKKSFVSRKSTMGVASRSWTPSVRKQKHPGSGYRVQGLECRDSSSGCRVEGLGCRVEGAGLRG